MTTSTPVRRSQGNAGRRSVAWRSTLWALGFSALLAAGPVATAGAGGQSPVAVAEPDPLHLTRDTRLTQYRAYRRMHARSERFNHEGWVEAWTEFDERGFRYEIVVERGSEYVRNKVLKELLKREQQVIAAGHAPRAELTGANYEFEDAARHGPGVRYVLLKPKRKDVLLVDGRMVLNQDGSELLRVEGRLAKNPSFWTTRVNVTREFARLDGVRVPISTESVARIRFAGLSRMQVEYEYDTINGRPVSLAARRTLAAATGR